MFVKLCLALVMMLALWACGSDSSSGSSGTSGTAGRSGKSGSGSAGTTGTAGTSGASGATANSGTSGATGSTATTGSTGMSGATTGTTGTTGVTGTTGAVVDAGVDATASVLQCSCDLKSAGVGCYYTDSAGQSVTTTKYVDVSNEAATCVFKPACWYISKGEAICNAYRSQATCDSLRGNGQVGVGLAALTTTLKACVNQYQAWLK